jgi:hypothetical protein
MEDTKYIEGLFYNQIESLTRKTIRKCVEV